MTKAATRDVRRLAARVLAIWIGIGFIANYAWEMLQMPLYDGMTDGWARCAHAAVSDVAVLAFLYAVMAAAAASWLWFRESPIPRSLALAAIAFLTAVLIELRALAAGKWSYADEMPLVPPFEVGLSPLVQMVVIPLALTWLSRVAARGGRREP